MEVATQEEIKEEITEDIEGKKYIDRYINDPIFRRKEQEKDSQQLKHDRLELDIEDEKYIDVFSEIDPGQLTESKIAEIIGIALKEKALYNDEEKQWYLWNGKLWEWDKKNQIVKFVQEIIKIIQYKMIDFRDQRKKEAIVTFLLKCENENKLEKIIKLLRSELPIITTEFDIDNFLFNCNNGTIDLQTGELQKHKPENQITKISSVDFIPDSPCPKWGKFLNEIFNGDKELIDYVQKICGSALSGDQSEHLFIILYGSGANGKTVFTNVLYEILGDYAAHTPTSTLMTKGNEQTNCDLARLPGVRFLTASEANENARLNESKIKQLTGGDMITARHLFGRFFTFKPVFKLFLVTNHKPIVQGTDYAIWRRIRLIPFLVTFPEEKQNKNLFNELMEEKEGILNWLMTGYLMYLNDGLKTPDIVLMNTNNYKNEMDTIGNFLNEYCTLNSEAKTKICELFSKYKAYCEENGETSISKKNFTLRLSEKGVEAKKSNGVWIYKGVKVT